MSGSYAPRIRKAKNWGNSSLAGSPLYMSDLSSRLTKVASTQLSICKVEAADYVLRKIHDREQPTIADALRAKTMMLEAIQRLIGELHWVNFETMIDLLLSRNGWHRVSSLGEIMKDADLIAEQVVTGEIAFIQVKSSSNQRELEGYTEAFDSNPQWSRIIFACHSPGGAITCSRPDIHIWTGTSLRN